MIEAKFTFDEIYVAKEDALQLKAYKDGVAVECTVASYVLYDSGRTEIASGEITPVGESPNNVLNVTVQDSAFSEVEENCSIEWTFTADGKVRSFNNFFDVVKWKIYCNVIDSDLERYFPDLSEHKIGQCCDDQIELAWEYVKGDIKAKGRRPSLIVVDNDIKKLIELKALYFIYDFFYRQATDDVWLLRADRAEQNYQDQFGKTTLKYDETQDGVVDNATGQNLGMVSMVR